MFALNLNVIFHLCPATEGWILDMQINLWGRDLGDFELCSTGYDGNQWKV